MFETFTEAASEQKPSQVRVNTWSVARGVFVGGWLFAASVAVVLGAVWFINYGLRQSAAAEQARQEAEYEQSQKAVGPQFKSLAANAGVDMHSEFSATRAGWKAYTTSHQKVKSDISVLSSTARTAHERQIAGDLDSLDSDLSLCVEDAISPSFHFESLNDCFKHAPESRIDEILQE